MASIFRRGEAIVVGQETLRSEKRKMQIENCGRFRNLRFAIFIFQFAIACDYELGTHASGVLCERSNLTKHAGGVRTQAYGFGH
jgi:hypothetical protein